MALINRLNMIRNHLADIAPTDEIAKVPPGEIYAVGRMLDSIIENATNLRAQADKLTDAKREALIRKVRKVLGYTYP